MIYRFKNSAKLNNENKITEWFNMSKKLELYKFILYNNIKILFNRRRT